MELIKLVHLFMKTNIIFFNSMCNVHMPLHSVCKCNIIFQKIRFGIRPYKQDKCIFFYAKHILQQSNFPKFTPCPYLLLSLSLPTLVPIHTYSCPFPYLLRPYPYLLLSLSLYTHVTVLTKLTHTVQCTVYDILYTIQYTL